MAIGPNPPGSHPIPDEDGLDPPKRQDIRLGNEGYAEEAEALARQYETVRFEDVHRHVLHLIPTALSDVLDIGAALQQAAIADRDDAGRQPRLG